MHAAKAVPKGTASLSGKECFWHSRRIKAELPCGTFSFTINMPLDRKVKQDDSNLVLSITEMKRNIKGDVLTLHRMILQSTGSKARNCMGTKNRYWPHVSVYAHHTHPTIVIFAQRGEAVSRKQQAQSISCQNPQVRLPVRNIMPLLQT
eukprot:6480432-Amphidinium_carterae.4